ncbi:MAG: DNA-3-methyladenine glycosylase family protein [Acidimicrobiales bacterium]
MARRTLTLPFALDLRRTLRPMRLGKHDPTILLADRAALWATRTADGPATVRVEHHGDRVQVEAWGDGAEDALEHAPASLGLLDDRRGFDPEHPLVKEMHHDADGLRLPRTDRVLESLVPAILGQRVTGFEAKRAYRQLIERWGEPAPGPGDLRLLPRSDVIAELPYYDLHVVGVEKKRADTLRRACAHANRLEAAGERGTATLRDRLLAIPGIGLWTVAEVTRLAHGDADAVSVGDVHLKHLVSWALAGEARGSDDRMLELLEPFAGHRGRVCLLIESSGISVPRRGARAEIEPIALR